MPRAALTPSEIRDFAFYGCVLVEDFLDADELAALRRHADEVLALPPGAGPATHHYERCGSGADGGGGGAESRRLCRVESFAPQHAALAALAREALAPLAAQLLGERAFLFKEKLNIKAARGGGGYAPHFDGPSAASAGLASRFVTAQLAVDEQTVRNGCLQVVMPRNACPDEEELEAAGVLLAPTGSDPDADGRVGAISPAVAAQLAWQALPCAAGSALLFHGLFPHRSPPNLSDAPRRTFYFLFNGESDGGDCHSRYIAHMAAARARFRERAAGAGAGAGGGGAPAEAAER
jgi:ectoine hydroxylase-related dioxygenase (phytanoyl-CoA dioxygenase family)